MDLLKMTAKILVLQKFNSDYSINFLNKPGTADTT